MMPLELCVGYISQSERASLHTPNQYYLSINNSMMFGKHTTTTTTRPTRSRGGFRNPLRRRDPDRVAGGYKAALANPNTTRQGRKQAKYSLKRMGRGNEAHVPFMTKVKRTLGIRSSPRRSTRSSVFSSTSTTRSSRSRGLFGSSRAPARRRH